jgi:hypothetical protein
MGKQVYHVENSKWYTHPLDLLKPACDLGGSVYHVKWYTP